MLRSDGYEMLQASEESVSAVEEVQRALRGGATERGTDYIDVTAAFSPPLKYKSRAQTLYLKSKRDNEIYYLTHY